MQIRSLKLKNFRNYNHFEGDFSTSLNIFVGPNAQGKTNLIEAIYIIGATKSFRRLEQDNLIKLNQKNAILQARAIKKNLEKDITFRFIENRRKEILVNNKRINKSSDYIGNINVTLFSPDDLMLVKGDSSFRRRFVDTLLCQTDNYYLTNLINYQRVLKQRNSLLKDIKNNNKQLSELEPWDEQLCLFGLHIIKKRYDLCEKINKISNKVQKKIKSNEDLTINYVDSVWQGEASKSELEEENFKNKLKGLQKEEIIRGTTLLGPHRDNLEISINELNTRLFGSQGQQRSVAISLRMAEVDYIYEVMDEYPVLLLDDIFSELDDQRKLFLFDYLDQNIQVFLTGTKEEDFKSLLDQSALYKVNNGQASKVEVC